MPALPPGRLRPIMTPFRQPAPLALATHNRALGTLVITRKGGKVATIPPAPRTARAIDLAISERSEGPIFLAAGGRRLDRHATYIVAAYVAGAAR